MSPNPNARPHRRTRLAAILATLGLGLAAKQAHEQAAAARPVLRVAHQSVELGSQSAYQGTTWVQIRQGVQAGDRILTGTAGGLREGTAVEVQEAQAANAPASGGGR